MAVTPSVPAFTRSPHLVDLIAEVERLTERLAAAPSAARAAARRDQAVEAVTATLVLDGAEAAALPDAATAAATAARIADSAPVGATSTDTSRRGTWLDALRALDDPHDDELRALEVVGAHAGEDADDLLDTILSDPLPALSELHRRLTRGLVAADRAGQPRTTDLAVQDGSTGRVLFFPTEPDLVPRELGLTEAWLASTATREHGLVVSGVLHHELLRIQPYDAANGRLARAAARLVLRARGLDPDHLAAPEPALARDPLGYHEEVARTLRRRDQTIWLERWGEAVADGMRANARRLGVLAADPAEHARRFAADHPAFTVADYRAELAASPQQTRGELVELLDAGVIRRVPGSRGLRYVTAG